MGGAAEHVQAKSFIDSMLQLSQRGWGRGEGLLGAVYRAVLSVKCGRGIGV